ncbi:hypothetical protein EHQ99_00170 [Leptospira bouyouniensis]|nr:hypothetical protein EHQ99_00170 [Leptospira bouyouniensis]
MNEGMFQLGVTLMLHSLILFCLAWGRPLLRALSQRIIMLNLKPRQSAEVIRYISLGGRR